MSEEATYSDGSEWREEIERRAKHWLYIRGKDRPRTKEQREHVRIRRGAAEYELCRTDFWYWVRHYGWIQAPHEDEGIKHPVRRVVPFIPWPKQVELLAFLEEGLRERTNRYAAKSRAVGGTWVALHYADHKLIFEPGFHTHLGSRSQDCVDEFDNDMSLMERARFILKKQPSWILPGGLDDGCIHSKFNVLANHETGASITGEATGKGFARSGRATLIVIDEAAEVPPSKMRQTFASVESVAACVWYIYNANTKVTASGLNPVYEKEQGIEAGRVMRLDWRTDPRRPENFRELKTMPIGDLTQKQFDREYCCIWEEGGEGVIFTFDRNVTEYRPDDLPAPEVYRRWPLFGFWDFGSGPSPTALLLVRLQVGSPSRMWVEHSLQWHRKTALVIAEEVKEILYARDDLGNLIYPNLGAHFGDPAGMSVDAMQRSWIGRLRAEGIPLSPLTEIYDRRKNKLVVNEKAFKDYAIGVIQEGLDDGTLRVHPRCSHMWGTLANWSWRVPQGQDIDHPTVIIDAPMKCEWSHIGDCACYMGTGLAHYLVGLRAESAMSSDSTPLTSPGGDAMGALQQAWGGA